MNFNFIEKDSQNRRGAVTLSVVDFFTDNNKNGYFSLEEFREYALNLLGNEKTYFAGFIHELKRGTRMDYDLFVRSDVSGKDYSFPKFHYSKATRGYKVVMNDAIKRLIDDYAEGRIKIDFNAEDLAKFAFTD